MTADLDERLAALDPCAGAPVADGSADDLLAAVIATPLEPSRSHRPRLAAAAVAAAVAVGITGVVLVTAPSGPSGPTTTVSPSVSAPALVTVAKKNGEIVVSINDSKADMAAVTAELERQGLDITVHRGASPDDYAGTGEGVAGQATVSRKVCADDPAKTCGFGFVLSDDFRGHAEVWLG